jgi:hypothetical protein
MPVQASDALEQQVYGGVVGDEQIDVDVEGLLGELGRDDHEPMGSLSTFRPARSAQQVEHALAPVCALTGGESRVQ